MPKLQRLIEKFKLACPVIHDALLSEYTTFRVGGRADVMAQPRTTGELARIVRLSREHEIPLTVLGGGANVVVSDQGIRGLVVHTGELKWIRKEGSLLRVGAGTPISDAAAFAAEAGLAGLAFIYAMPGSTGGAIWMNARCYGGEIAPILRETTFVTLAGSEPASVGVYTTDPADFDYKISPFQDGTRIIVEGVFELHAGDRTQLRQEMCEHEEDRRAKGHFAAPCAGSIFKNNHAFGAPSGQIIDRLGLRGTRLGGARVSENHGNIIINTGTATAAEIRGLTEYVQKQVERETGFTLEPEVLFIGQW